MAFSGFRGHAVATLVHQTKTETNRGFISFVDSVS